MSRCNRLACDTVKNIVKVHCNLRLVDSIEEIVRSDVNIDWSSDDDEHWLTDIEAAFELLRTFTNFIFFLNFFMNFFWTLF